MDLIGTTELKEKLDRGERFKLVMSLGGWAYRAKHIPGSVCLSTMGELLEALDPDDEIVIYDSGPYCARSRRAYRFLKANGYERVRCLAGGLEEWESAGYYLESERHHDSARDQIERRSGYVGRREQGQGAASAGGGLRPGQAGARRRAARSRLRLL